MLVFQGPKQDVQCLAFVPGPAGNSIAAGYWGDLFIWPLSGGEPIELPLAAAAQLPGTSGLEEIAVSPNGEWIVGRWHRGTRLWRRSRGKWTDAVVMEFSASSIAFRGKDLFLVNGERTETQDWVYHILRARVGTRHTFAVRDTVLTQSHPQSMVTAGSGVIELSPDGRTLATAAREKAVQLWDTLTGKHVATLSQRGFVEVLAWSPDGATLALNAGMTIRLYEVKTRA